MFLKQRLDGLAHVPTTQMDAFPTFAATHRELHTDGKPSRILAPPEDAVGQHGASAGRDAAVLWPGCVASAVPHQMPVATKEARIDTRRHGNAGRAASGCLVLAVDLAHGATGRRQAGCGKPSRNAFRRGSRCRQRINDDGRFARRRRKPRERPWIAPFEAWQQPMPDEAAVETQIGIGRIIFPLKTSAMRVGNDLPPPQTQHRPHEKPTPKRALGRHSTRRPPGERLPKPRLGLVVRVVG